jgi:hypothetical protein
MPHSSPSTSHDEAVPRVPLDFDRMRTTKLSLLDRDRAVQRLCRALAGTAVVIGLIVLAATSVPPEGVASYPSGAAPTLDDETASEVRHDDTGYFPDEFVVEHWDKSPLPEPFYL